MRHLITLLAIVFTICCISIAYAGDDSETDAMAETVTTSDYTINIGGDGTIVFNSDGNTIGPSTKDEEESEEQEESTCECKCDSRQNVRGGFYGYGYETVIWVINPKEEYEIGMLQISNTRYPVRVAPLSQGVFVLSEFVDESGACSIMLESEALILDIEREKIE